MDGKAPSSGRKASKANVVPGSKYGSAGKSTAATSNDESWYFGTMAYFDPDFIEKKWQQRQKSRQKQKNEGNHWGIWELTRKGLVFKPKDAERYHKIIEKHHKKYGKRRVFNLGLDEFVAKTGNYGNSPAAGTPPAAAGRKKPTTAHSPEGDQQTHVSTQAGDAERLITLEDVKRVALTMLKMMLQKYRLGPHNSDNHHSNSQSPGTPKSSASRHKQDFDALAGDAGDQASPELPNKLRTLVESTDSDLLCICLLNYFHHYRVFISLPNALFVRKNAPGVRNELMKLQSELQLALIRLCRAFSNVLLSRGRFNTNKIQSNYPGCISLYLVNDRFLMESYYEYLFNMIYVAFERKSGLELRGEFGRLFRTPAFNPFDVRRVMQDLRNYIEYTLQAKAMTRQLNAASREAAKKLAADKLAEQDEIVASGGRANDETTKSNTNNNKTLNMAALRAMMSPRAKLSKRQADKLFLLANAGVQKHATNQQHDQNNVQNEVSVVEEVLQFVRRKRFHSRRITTYQHHRNSWYNSNKKRKRPPQSSKRPFGLRKRRSSMYWPMVTGARAAKSEEQIILEKANLWRERFRYRRSLMHDYPAMQSAWYTSPIISAMYSETFTTAMRQMCADHLRGERTTTSGSSGEDDGKQQQRRRKRLISMKQLYMVIDELVSLPLDTKIGIIGKPLRCYYAETLLPQESDDADKAFAARQQQQQTGADSKPGTPVVAAGEKPPGSSPTAADGGAAAAVPTAPASNNNNANIPLSPANAAANASRALTESERKREQTRIAGLVTTIYDTKYRAKSVFEFFRPAEPKLPPTPRPEINYDLVFGGDPADTQWVEQWVSRPDQYPLFRRTHTEEEERLHRYFMQQQQRENAFYEQVLEYQTQEPPPSQSSSPTDRTIHSVTNEEVVNSELAVKKLATALVDEVSRSISSGTQSKTEY